MTAPRVCPNCGEPLLPATTTPTVVSPAERADEAARRYQAATSEMASATLDFIAALRELDDVDEREAS